MVFIPNDSYVWCCRRLLRRRRLRLLRRWWQCLDHSKLRGWRHDSLSTTRRGGGKAIGNNGNDDQPQQYGWHSNWLHHCAVSQREIMFRSSVLCVRSCVFLFFFLFDLIRFCVCVVLWGDRSVVTRKEQSITERMKGTSIKSDLPSRSTWKSLHYSYCTIGSFTWGLRSELLTSINDWSDWCDRMVGYWRKVLTSAKTNQSLCHGGKRQNSINCSAMLDGRDDGRSGSLTLTILS